MKISVSVRGKSPDSHMDPRFGRGAGFVLFDTDTGNTAYLDNSDQQDRTQGNGIKTAQMIVAAGADARISGHIGPKVAQILSRSGIRLYVCQSGIVQEAIPALGRIALKTHGNDVFLPGPGKMGDRGMGGGGRGFAQGGRARGGW